MEDAPEPTADLRNLSEDSFDPVEFIEELAEADVVVVARPGEQPQLVKGDEQLQGVLAAGRTKQLVVANLIVANLRQLEMIAGVVHLIGEGQMTEERTQTFWRLFVNASRQSDPN